MENIFWKNFKGEVWKNEINVRDFIQQNYKEYTGYDSFLAKATERTNELMSKVQALFKLERAKGGVLDVDTDTVSSFIFSFNEKVKYTSVKSYLLLFVKVIVKALSPK